MIANRSSVVGFILLLPLLFLGPCPADGADIHPPGLSLERIDGIWISRVELAALPTGGKAWKRMMKEVKRSVERPDLSNQEDKINVRVLARALVYGRTGQSRHREEVIRAIEAAMGTEAGARSLSLGRELVAYILAADLVTLPADLDARFKKWLHGVLRQKNKEGRSVIQTHEQRPNNWGTHAGASRMAAAIYLKDVVELKKAAEVFKGYLGDKKIHRGFRFRETKWWQADPFDPVGVNPKGAMRDGHDIDGVPADDQRRAGPFSWPPPKENYVYEAMQGALTMAVMLHRLGYDVWNWEDRALLRVFNWLHQVADFPAKGDDVWEMHLVNHYYGTRFPAAVPTKPGKGMGFTDWTHGAKKQGRSHPSNTSPFHLR